MCVATALTALGMTAETAATVGSTLTAVGTLSSGLAGYQSAKAQQSAAEANVGIAKAQAAAAVSDAAVKERAARRRGAQFAGKQKSLIAASGTGSGGSSMDILMDTAAGVEDDASAIRLTGERQSWGYNMQAQQYQYDAKVAGQSAMGSLLGGVLSAGAGALSSSNVLDASSKTVDSSWYTSKSMGLYGDNSLINPDRRY